MQGLSLLFQFDIGYKKFFLLLMGMLQIRYDLFLFHTKLFHLGVIFSNLVMFDLECINVIPILLIKLI